MMSPLGFGRWMPFRLPLDVSTVDDVPLGFGRWMPFRLPLDVSTVDDVPP